MFRSIESNDSATANTGGITTKKRRSSRSFVGVRLLFVVVLLLSMVSNCCHEFYSFVFAFVDSRKIELL